MDVAASGTASFLTIGSAARILGLSTSRVRQLADCGALAVMKTDGGVRLFQQREVERLASQREASLRSERSGDGR